MLFEFDAFNSVSDNNSIKRNGIDIFKFDGVSKFNGVYDKNNNLLGVVTKITNSMYGNIFIVTNKEKCYQRKSMKIVCDMLES